MDSSRLTDQIAHYRAAYRWERIRQAWHHRHGNTAQEINCELLADTAARELRSMRVPVRG